MEHNALRLSSPVVALPGPRATWTLVGLAGAGLFLALAMWTPPGERELTWCLFRRLTSVPCPGCGLTRAISALAHGDLRLSWHIHPLGIAFVAQAALGWILAGARLLLPAKAIASHLANRLLTPDRVSRWLLVNAVVLVLVWIFRAATGTLPAT